MFSIAYKSQKPGEVKSAYKHFCGVDHRNLANGLRVHPLKQAVAAYEKAVTAAPPGIGLKGLG